ncbi:similar to pseudouridine synthase [Plenodomus lingam JN3]|uniref:tRNA pseudouridine(55) synthase n=2 Tax=Leptosphaeria maculans TaxID=5022 RepID=E4ZYX3_LEPMJ|nr:similar to pseudouridine synthase [Plenodomus lingam JN3]CBX96408.1 similar to pseudouridine synthase [Plenodomus lingam JN3]
MASSAAPQNKKIVEGIFAINKPPLASSAGVLRDLQTHFSTSPLFHPWLESQRRAMYLSNARPRHISNLKVKLGHGGTLDPMATGVLIVGVGKGTKCLQRFLECTKTYECTVLFGAATDTYDAVGKVVGKAEYAHVTRQLVEDKLGQFRGKIMQKPSVFSALKVDGKKMYEYAREGGAIPEVAARPVEVLEMELVEWLEPGSHDFKWPEEEVDGEQMAGAKKLLGIRKQDMDTYTDIAARRSRKRSRSPQTESDHVENAGEQPKRPRTDSEPAMSGALPEAQDTNTNTDITATTTATESATSDTPQAPPSQPQAPAARLRMTVTSGFYVRSLCHDLGLACNSLALMSSLIRTRQGAYCLPGITPPDPSTTPPLPVLEYADLDAGEHVWEPKVRDMLEGFMQSEGWEVDELEGEESWEERKDRDRERSYRGGGGGGGGWKGKGKGNGGWNAKGNGYSKKMDGGGG